MEGTNSVFVIVIFPPDGRTDVVHIDVAPPNDG